VALLQRKLTDRIPATFGVRALRCPFDVSPLVEAMWWHPMYDNDPEHLYLRDVLIRATSRADAEPGSERPSTQHT